MARLRPSRITHHVSTIHPCNPFNELLPSNINCQRTLGRLPSSMPSASAPLFLSTSLGGRGRLRSSHLPPTRVNYQVFTNPWCRRDTEMQKHKASLHRPQQSERTRTNLALHTRWILLFPPLPQYSPRLRIYPHTHCMFVIGCLLLFGIRHSAFGPSPLSPTMGTICVCSICVCFSPYPIFCAQAHTQPHREGRTQVRPFSLETPHWSRGHRPGRYYGAVSQSALSHPNPLVLPMSPVMGTVRPPPLVYAGIVNFGCDASAATESEIEVCVGRMQIRPFFFPGTPVTASASP